MNDPEIPKINPYERIFASRSSEELHRLARTKRFMERLTGDAKFRDKLSDNVDHPGPLAEEFGLGVDPAELRPFWHKPFMKERHSESVEKDWPRVAEWDRYIADMLRHRDAARTRGDTSAINPRFHAWRQRQIRRSDSEVGSSAAGIVHPIVSYELSDGCSVGCWFCGISADKFKGNYPYTPENSKLWRGILEAMVDLFGEAAQTGFCYWATDPSDNPDYPKFVEDHCHVTGALPQTTTAAPLKDVAMTRELLRLQHKYPNLPSRFSILSVRILNAVHAEFTADELMRVELIMQQKNALLAKADSGRARQRRQRLRTQGRDDRLGVVETDHSTIACVSGFLVNLIRGTVKLVSPTRASEQWPLGYRVHAEGQFDSPASFRLLIEQIIEEVMGSEIPTNQPITFRDDLEFQPIDDGFALQSKSVRHTVKGLNFVGRLGELIRHGDKTSGEVLAQMVAEGEDVFLVSAYLQSLVDDGLIKDDPRMVPIGLLSGKTIQMQAGANR